MANQPQGPKKAKNNNNNPNPKRQRGKKPAVKPSSAPSNRPAPSAPLVRLAFTSDHDWNLEKLDTAVGFQEIYFGPDFSIKDEHVLAIASRPHLTKSLQVYTAGSSDSGNGGQVTDAALLELIPHLQSIKTLRLDAHNRITGNIFKALTALPSLAILSITGHDRSHGRIDSASLADLKTSKSLREVTFWDQSIKDKDAKLLSKINGGIRVGTGETDGDSMASQMVASMGGGGCSSWFVNGKEQYGW